MKTMLEMGNHKYFDLMVEEQGALLMTNLSEENVAKLTFKWEQAESSGEVLICCMRTKCETYVTAYFEFLFRIISILF